MKRSCQNVTNVTKWYWRSVAIQTISKPENYHDAGFKLRADARVRIHELLQICLGYRS